MGGGTQCHGQQRRRLPANFPFLAGDWPQGSPRVGTQAMCCRKTVCVLVPQGPITCYFHCVDTTRVCLPLQGVHKSQQAPSVPLQRFMLKNFCQLDASRQTPLVCKPQRGTGGPASTHGLGNDEVANHQVRGGAHGAFWIPVTKRHLMALPDMP